MEYRLALKAAQRLSPRKARLTKNGEIRIGQSCPITYIGNVLCGLPIDPCEFARSADELKLDFTYFGVPVAQNFVDVADYTQAELKEMGRDKIYVSARKKLLKLFHLKELT